MDVALLQVNHCLHPASAASTLQLPSQPLCFSLIPLNGMEKVQGFHFIHSIISLPSLSDFPSYGFASICRNRRHSHLAHPCCPPFSGEVKERQHGGQEQGWWWGQNWYPVLASCPNFQFSLCSLLMKHHVPMGLKFRTWSQASNYKHICSGEISASRCTYITTQVHFKEIKTSRI